MALLLPGPVVPVRFQPLQAQR